jgi:hypothetical protein
MWKESKWGEMYRVSIRQVYRIKKRKEEEHLSYSIYIS